MIRLIKNELIKVFNKKSTWVTLLICIGFISLVTFIYTRNFISVYEPEDFKLLVTEYESYIANLNSKSSSYYVDLANYSSELEKYKTLDKYSDNSWKSELIQDEYSEYLQKYFTAKYITKNDNEKNMYLDKITDINNILDANDWKKYVDYRIQKIVSDIDEQKLLLANTTNQVGVRSIENNIEYLEYLLNLYNYRLTNNVEYNESFLDNSLRVLTTTKYTQIDLKNKATLSKEEALQYEEINKTVLTNEYIIEHKVDASNYKSLKSVLESFVDEYTVLIVVFAILVSGAIVSEEYQKGTIKSLLITPHSRIQIIISKYLSSMILIFIAIVIMWIYQFLLGGIVFGFKSLSIPVLVYDYLGHNIINYNVFVYSLIRIAAVTPYLVMIMTIAFMLSTTLCSSGGAISITFFTIIGASIINNLISTFKLYSLRFLITLHWDFSQYLFGVSPTVDFINLRMSLIIYAIYLVIFIYIAFSTFKNRNIKNI